MKFIYLRFLTADSPMTKILSISAIRLTELLPTVYKNKKSVSLLTYRIHKLIYRVNHDIVLETTIVPLVLSSLKNSIKSLLTVS